MLNATKRIEREMRADAMNEAKSGISYSTHSTNIVLSIDNREPGWVGYLTTHNRPFKNDSQYKVVVGYLMALYILD